MRSTLLIVSAVLGLARPVYADAKKDQAAVANLDATYAATAKASGASRATQACTDEKAIEKAANDLPKAPPGGSVLDKHTWDAMRSSVLLQLNDLGEVCAAADKKLTHLGGKVETADDVVARVDEAIRAAIDGGKRRDLPSDMKKLGTAIAAAKTASACAKQKSLEKLSQTLATPASVDAAKWKAGTDALAAALAEVKQFACGTPHGASEEIAGALDQLRQAYVKLELAIPVS